jgi:hypothetical protein
MKHEILWNIRHCEYCNKYERESVLELKDGGFQNVTLSMQPVRRVLCITGSGAGADDLCRLKLFWYQRDNLCH